MKEEEHLQNLGVDGRILLKWVFMLKGLDWIDMAQGRDTWRPAV